jgi:hypothetical protein
MGIFLRESSTHAATPMPVSPPIGGNNRARSAPYNAPRSIVASAERINLATATVQNRPYAEWQREAWMAYERVGEIHFGFNLLANLLSRVRIYPASIGEANEAPVDLRVRGGTKKVSSKLAKAAEAAMDDLQRTDFASMTRSFSLNISVPGESYLVGPCPATNDMWSIRSVDEITVRAGGAVLNSTRATSQGLVTLPSNLFVARMWRQHPRWSREPDSSMVAVADSVEELLMLQRLVRSATRSRLNAGLLFVPDGIAAAGVKATAEPVLEEPGDPMEALAQQSTVDPAGPFMAQLMESMTTPISDEGSASAVVPMLATGPGELGAQIKHVTFARESDQWLVERIDGILNRILQGLDMPKEIVTGLQHVRYSNAVVIDEGLYKANIEPLALVYVDALTQVYLRPVLLGQGFTEAELDNIVVWYDPSEIVTRPNKEDEATQGTDRLLLSPAAWRREHGYPESDAPDEEDLALMLLNKMTALPPEVITKLLQQSMPTILKDLQITDTTVGPNGPSDPNQATGQSTNPNVVKFPAQSPNSQPKADPQRTAIQQVGVK